MRQHTYSLTGHLRWLGCHCGCDGMQKMHDHDPSKHNNHRKQDSAAIHRLFCPYQHVPGVNCNGRLRVIVMLVPGTSDSVYMVEEHSCGHSDHKQEEQSDRKGIPKHVQELLSPSKKRLTSHSLRATLLEKGGYQPQTEAEDRSLCYYRRKHKRQFVGEDIDIEAADCMHGVEQFCLANSRDTLELEDHFTCHTPYVIQDFICQEDASTPTGQYLVYMMTTDHMAFNAARAWHGPLETTWCVDSTHKLVRQGHAVFVVGVPDVSLKFRKVAVGVLSEKSERAHVAAMAMVKAEIERCHNRQILLGAYEEEGPYKGMPPPPAPPPTKKPKTPTPLVYEATILPQ